MHVLEEELVKESQRIFDHRYTSNVAQEATPFRARRKKLLKENTLITKELTIQL